MMLNYLSPTTNVVMKFYLPRRNIASSNKLHTRALVMRTLDHALLTAEDDDVARLVQIPLSAYTASAVRHLLPAEDALVLWIASRYGSRGAITPELRRLLCFAITNVQILRVVELLEYAVVTAALLEASRPCAVLRSHASDAVGIVSVRLPDIEIYPRALRHGAVGDPCLYTEGFYSFVDMPLYGIHE